MKVLGLFFCLSVALVLICSCGKPKETAQASPGTTPAAVASQSPESPEQTTPLTFETEVARLTENTESRVEKINQLFTYVRDSIRQIPVNYG